MKSIGSAPPPVSGWICVIVVAIGAHQHSKHRVSSAWSVGVALLSILLIVQFEIYLASMIGSAYQTAARVDL